MSTTRLPALPRGYPIQWTPNPDGPTDIVYGFDEVHAYGLAVWKAAMEQAARTCTEWGGARLPARGGDALRNCADAIRSLPLPEQGSPQ